MNDELKEIVYILKEIKDMLCSWKIDNESLILLLILILVLLLVLALLLIGNILSIGRINLVSIYQECKLYNGKSGIKIVVKPKFLTTNINGYNWSFILKYNGDINQITQLALNEYFLEVLIGQQTGMYLTMFNQTDSYTMDIWSNTCNHNGMLLDCLDNNREILITLSLDYYSIGQNITVNYLSNYENCNLGINWYNQNILFHNQFQWNDNITGFLVILHAQLNHNNDTCKECHGWTQLHIREGLLLPILILLLLLILTLLLLLLLILLLIPLLILNNLIEFKNIFIGKLTLYINNNDVYDSILNKFSRVSNVITSVYTTNGFNNGSLVYKDTLGNLFNTGYLAYFNLSEQLIKVELLNGVVVSNSLVSISLIQNLLNTKILSLFKHYQNGNYIGTGYALYDNNANFLYWASKLEISSDGLTITDSVWANNLTLSNINKYWKFNKETISNNLLINFKILEIYKGNIVEIEIVSINNTNPNENNSFFYTLLIGE